MVLVRFASAVGALALSLAVMVAPAGGEVSLELLGAYDPGTAGLNASATGLNGVAYLGSWGSPQACGSLGARVVDVRDPTAPVPMGSVAAYTRSTTEFLQARTMDGPVYWGAVLFAAIQRCDARAGDEGGLAVWDVSDPTNPRELSYFGVGQRPRGVHEFALAKVDERWLAFLAVPNSELLTGSRGAPVGDLRIVDVTDPEQPVALADWGAQRDAGLPVGYSSECAPYCRGDIAQAFLHSVSLSPDGQTAYLSYWDLGVIILDVSDPTTPRYLGRFAEPRSAEGDTHSVAVTPDNRLALVADERFEPPWGFLRLVDVQDSAQPVQVGQFDTINSAAQRRGSGETWYGIHNPLIDDRDPTRAYLAWYADGVRVIDFANPSAVEELASWVPPRDAQVWSVALMDELVIVGDVNTGLYLLRRLPA